MWDSPVIFFCLNSFHDRVSHEELGYPSVWSLIGSEHIFEKENISAILVKNRIINRTWACTGNIWKLYEINLFQLSDAFSIKTSHFICTAN